MFTGIISTLGTIASAKQTGDLRLVVTCPWHDLRLGESIAVNGACLTVVDRPQGAFACELSAETIGCTAPRWQTGGKVNLERAMKLGDALDGHLVTGHVDGMATILETASEGDSHVLCLGAPTPLARYIAAKGSVTLDGVSLTVNKVEGGRFWVNIVPHTWRHTTFHERTPGDALNLEIDLIARYVERLLSHTEVQPKNLHVVGGDPSLRSG